MSSRPSAYRRLSDDESQPSALRVHSEDGALGDSRDGEEGGMRTAIRRSSAQVLRKLSSAVVRDGCDSLPLSPGRPNSARDAAVLPQTTNEEQPAAPILISETVFFNIFAVVVIFGNCLVLALEAVYMSAGDLRREFEDAQCVFTAFYTAELFLRMWDAGGIRSFLKGADAAWNAFDTLIIVVSLVDVVLDLATGTGSKGTGVMRVFRVLRILRLLRAVKFLAEVDHVLVQATVHLFKFTLLVVIVLFIFAILATNLLWDDPDEVTSSMFKDLWSSMWSLFKMMTLDGWIEIVERASATNPNMLYFFSVFIFLSFTSVSIVPAIFIETAFIIADFKRKSNQESIAFKEREREVGMLRQLYQAAYQQLNGQVRIPSLLELLRDRAFVSKLKEKGDFSYDDVYDVKLGLYDAWESRHEDQGSDGNLEFMLSEDEFIENVFRTRNSSSQVALWRVVTAARLDLQEASQQQRARVRSLERAWQQDVADWSHLITSAIQKEIRGVADLIAREHKQELERNAALLSAAKAETATCRAQLEAADVARQAAAVREAELKIACDTVRIELEVVRQREARLDAAVIELAAVRQREATRTNKRDEHSMSNSHIAPPDYAAKAIDRLRSSRASGSHRDSLASELRSPSSDAAALGTHEAARRQRARTTPPQETRWLSPSASQTRQHERADRSRST